MMKNTKFINYIKINLELQRLMVINGLRVTYRVYNDHNGTYGIKLIYKMN
jgi:hypothetical protein